MWWQALLKLALPAVMPFVEPVLKLVTTHIRETIIVVLAAFIIYQNFFETRFLFFVDTIPHLQAQVSDLKENVATLNTTITNRNAEVDKWKQVSDALERQSAEPAKSIGKDHERTLNQVKDILSDKTPKTCSDAMDYLRHGVEDLKW